jgi:acetoin:2,6-dichlorophenolindophenol oxidoreductase subunit beta
MPKITFAQAFVDGLAVAMAEDPRVNLVGSHFLGLGPLRGLMHDIREHYADRIFDPPISESAASALGIGAAMAGDRPVVDIGTASFAFEAWSQIINEAGNAHYMTGGQINVPVMFHMLHGLRGGSAAQHGGSPQAMLWNCPGLEIVLPSSPRDAKGLLLSAIRSPNPTVFVSHAKLLGLEGEVPEEPYTIPFGVADIKRAGCDVTIVATSLMVSRALDAATQLSASGIDAEVLDPRTLVPFDRAALLKSVEKTGRLVVVDETNTSCGVAAEITAIVAEHGFRFLKAPVKRVSRPDVPVPFSPKMEEAITVTPDKIARAVRDVLA